MMGQERDHGNVFFAPDGAGGSRRGEEITRNQISRISAIIRPAGSSRWTEPQLIYLGWTRDGRPIAQTDRNNLTAEARTSLAAYQGTRLPVRETEFARLEPVGYQAIAKAIDFPDRCQFFRTEDVIILQVQDQEGKGRHLTIGEVDLLRAIVEAGILENQWQDTVTLARGELVSSTTPMYTLLVQTRENGHSSAMAVLFEPVVANSSNEATYQRFVRDVIGRLLIIDESQQPENRKGYVQAAGKIAGGEGSLTLTEIIDALIQLDDEHKARLERLIGNIKANILQVLDLFVEVNRSDIEAARNPLPNYDIDKLDLKRLLTLASAMHKAAAEFVRKDR